METCCNYTSTEMFVSTDERWLINRIMRLAENKPGEVQILHYPQDNDGCLYCKMPSNWLRITPPTKRELTDEQRAAAVERLKNYHK